MRARGLRLLGWAVHLAFFVAWWQVALLMDRQMHDGPKAPAPEAAATRLSQEGESPAREPARSEGVPLAGGPGRARPSQLGMRAT